MNASWINSKQYRTVKSVNLVLIMILSCPFALMAEIGDLSGSEVIEKVLEREYSLESGHLEFLYGPIKQDENAILAQGLRVYVEWAQGARYRLGYYDQESNENVILIREDSIFMTRDGTTWDERFLTEQESEASSNAPPELEDVFQLARRLWSTIINAYLFPISESRQHDYESLNRVSSFRRLLSEEASHIVDGQIVIEDSMSYRPGGYSSTNAIRHILTFDSTNLLLLKHELLNPDNMNEIIPGLDRIMPHRMTVKQWYDPIEVGNGVWLAHKFEFSHGPSLELDVSKSVLGPIPESRFEIERDANARHVEWPREPFSMEKKITAFLNALEDIYLIMDNMVARIIALAALACLVAYLIRRRKRRQGVKS